MSTVSTAIQFPRHISITWWQSRKGTF